jgi:YebC/PmpR family DNA-binding regulatory protein
MSGHSKWATIKRAKGVKDAKRGAAFTKLSKAISIAVKQGGGVTDPGGNFRLRLAIEAARAASMPKENIDRAIQKGGSKNEADLDEATYEGFGPGGFSVIVETVTDNKLRTVSEVKNIFNKNGGSMGAQGSVMYQFEKKGVVTIEKDGKSLDDIFMIAIDSGAEDIEDADTEVLVYTKPEDVAKARDGLAAQGLNIKTIEHLLRPVVINTLTDQAQAEKAMDFLDKLESLDDVQKVYANFDIPDELIGNTLDE